MDNTQFRQSVLWLTRGLLAALAVVLLYSAYTGFHGMPTTSWPLLLGVIFGWLAARLGDGNKKTFHMFYTALVLFYFPSLYSAVQGGPWTSTGYLPSGLLLISLFCILYLDGID